jgi:hypothetical protein
MSAIKHYACMERKENLIPNPLAYAIKQMYARDVYYQIQTKKN